MIEIKKHGLRIWKVGEADIPKDAVYVGRPQKFGNPWSHLKNSGSLPAKGKAEAVAKFAEYVKVNLAMGRYAREELAGKDLVCWCDSLPCHATILMDLANEVTEKVASNNRK